VQRCSYDGPAEGEYHLVVPCLAMVSMAPKMHPAHFGGVTLASRRGISPFFANCCK
jgi:hypothetical protein